MTGAELQKLRRRSGLSLAKFGAALGFRGKNIDRAIRRLDGYGSAAVPQHVAERAAGFEQALAKLEEKWRADKPDPRDPDYSRSGIFQTHNCWKCANGAKPCVSGSSRQCEYPHARND